MCKKDMTAMQEQLGAGFAAEGFVIPLRDQHAKRFYDIAYGSLMKSDSPPESRGSMIKRVHPYIIRLPKGSFVLDVGAGRGLLEAEYIHKFGKPDCQFVTLEIAEVGRGDLEPDVSIHIQGNGRKLPFSKNSIGFAFGNLSVDLVGEEGLAEIYRVLSPNGHAVFNFSDSRCAEFGPSHQTYMDNLASGIDSFTRSGLLPHPHLMHEYTRMQYKKMIAEQKILFGSEKDVKKALDKAGLTIQNLTHNRQLSDFHWWEVEAQKLDAGELEATMLRKRGGDASLIRRATYDWHEEMMKQRRMKSGGQKRKI